MRRISQSQNREPRLTKIAIGGRWQSPHKRIYITAVGRTNAHLAEEPNNPDDPRSIEVSGSGTVPTPTARATLRIAYADDVVVEDSDTLKRLWRSDYNYYLVRKRVYMVVSGEKPVEITTDASAEDEAEYG